MSFEGKIESAATLRLEHPYRFFDSNNNLLGYFEIVDNYDDDVLEYPYKIFYRVVDFRVIQPIPDSLTGHSDKSKTRNRGEIEAIVKKNFKKKFKVRQK